MTTHKPAGKKRRLGRALKQNRPVPPWVYLKTKGRVRSSPKRRNWRGVKLKL
ncbi:MAG: 50S ribosomal protein L39e [Candidatus Bathyarchaeia archaeon]